MEFKRYIREKRIDLNISEEEASLKIGCSISTIQNWENGAAIPDTKSIKNIANAYNLKECNITNRLGKQLNKEKYLSVLPSNLNYSLIEGLEFNEKEVELFLILALSSEFPLNPIQSMYKKTNNYLDIVLFLDKLKKYDLYTNSNIFFKHNSDHCGEHIATHGEIYTNTINLTEKGMYIYKYIKDSRSDTFNIYSLNFTEFLYVCELYHLIEDANIMIDILDEICREKDYYLNKFEKYNDIKYIQRAVYSNTILNKYNTNIASNISRSNMLTKYIDSEYYSVIEEECNDEFFLIEKEEYKKKIEFYKMNKDLDSNLVEPEKYEEKIYFKVIPTEKAIKFIDYINNK